MAGGCFSQGIPQTSAEFRRLLRNSCRLLQTSADFCGLLQNSARRVYGTEECAPQKNLVILSPTWLASRRPLPDDRQAGGGAATRVHFVPPNGQKVHQSYVFFRVFLAVVGRLGPAVRGPRGYWATAILIAYGARIR